MERGLPPHHQSKGLQKPPETNTAKPFQWFGCFFLKPRISPAESICTVIVCVIAILAGIFVIAGAVVVTTSERYFKNHYAARNPPWVSDIFLRGRVFLGQYREPPSNEEMIRYFHQHEAEFEQLITDYYAIVKYAYDNYHTTSFPDRSDMLRFQMAELGIRWVTAGGLSYRIQFMAINHFKPLVCICTCLIGAVV